MKKKILRVIINEKVEQEKNPINKNLGYTFKNEKKICNFIENISKDKKAYDFKKNIISKNHIHNNKNKLSSKELANFMKKILKI